uniref:Uncharacterized protein n=1 Tax=Arundo donax TaxID=35708 RepID=A0A0A9EWJ3_ARUDO
MCWRRWVSTSSWDQRYTISLLRQLLASTATVARCPKMGCVFPGWNGTAVDDVLVTARFYGVV